MSRPRRVLADDPTIRREIERGLRERQRAKLAELRARIKAARASKREALKGARMGCVLARRLLADECATKRATARSACSTAIEKARARGDAEVVAALDALADERALQRAGRSLAKAAKSSSRMTARERRAESDDEVRANIPRELHAVFERVKRGLPRKDRASRTEVFLEWVAEHGAEVAEIQADEDFRGLQALQREERRLAKSLRAPRGKRSIERLRAELAELDDVPF